MVNCSIAEHQRQRKKVVIPIYYVYFNIVSNPAQKVANVSVGIVVNELSDSCI